MGMARDGGYWVVEELKEWAKGKIDNDGGEVARLMGGAISRTEAERISAAAEEARIRQGGGGHTPDFRHRYLMANGGIARATRGGVNATLGEGGRDELVMPLPRGLNPNDLGKNETTINIHGDLSFPNVRNGSDARDFIENLEALVGRN
jgi:hypothetical protein